MKGGMFLATLLLGWNNRVRVVRANLDGSDPTVLADLRAPSIDSQIKDMAVGDSDVYWSTCYQSAIWRSPR